MHRLCTVQSDAVWDTPGKMYTVHFTVVAVYSGDFEDSDDNLINCDNFLRVLLRAFRKERTSNPTRYLANLPIYIYI